MRRCSTVKSLLNNGADANAKNASGRPALLVAAFNGNRVTARTLLSAGADYKTFNRQVEIACKAGASGFLAGRALWQEGVQISSRKERADFRILCS